MFPFLSVRMSRLFILLVFLKDATSMRVASKNSDDNNQYAVCSKTYKSTDEDYTTIERTHDDMRSLRAELIRYCELRGVFVFYSEEEFQVFILINY